MNPHMLLFRYAMTRPGELARPHRDGAPTEPVISNVETQRRADRYAARGGAKADGGSHTAQDR
ncbi:MAG: hypothetical protein NW217_13635 [Hyphomicrobiaceae bacterium]|nr:hypothetical protein [Hyphomicrobiaceae bacterium]